VAQLDRREIAAIFLGGAAGSLLRVWLAQTVTSTVATWPWATFIANVSGCFALGLIATHLRERPPEAPHWHPLLGTGFCGAYTTFSTFAQETLGLVEERFAALALVNAAGSIVVGVLAVFVGERAGRML
jgi:CrcB protein